MISMCRTITSAMPRARGNTWLAAAGICATLASTGALAKGNPFAEIEQQVAALDVRVDVLDDSVSGLSDALNALSDVVDQQQFSNMPIALSVDCAAGESLAAALNEYVNASAPLSINVNGVCAETAYVLRSNVSITGEPGAGVHTPFPGVGNITVANGARNVRISDLALSGGLGVVVTRNAQAVLDNVDVSNSANGVLALDNSHVYVQNSRLFNNSTGGIARANGNLVLNNSVVENNQVGLYALASGIVQLTPRTAEGPMSAGVIVRNNFTGFVGQTGSRLLLTDATFENNSNMGIFLHTQSAAHFFAPIVSGGNSISGSGFGVMAYKNTSLLFAGATHAFTNNTTGIRCNADTSYFTAFPGALPGPFSGNVTDVEGCTGP